MTESTVDALARWRWHPAQMVRDLFGVEPDPWQVEILEAFPHNTQLAMLAAKGPGKTCVLAWLCWNFLLTRPYPNIGATSITGQNLADGLWKEMAKWQAASPLLKTRFTWTQKRIFANEAPETWFMSAKPYSRDANPEQQAQTLAGFHADYILFMVDESGGMADAVMATAEATLSSCVEGHIVQAGNPTHLEGPLYRAATVGRKENGGRWWVTSITGDPDDPKRAPRIAIDWARDQIKAYGRDNPWVLVNVFGRFPPSSLNALIGPDEVEAAMNRAWKPEDIRSSPKILGVDVARFGDDASCIVKRQGLQAFIPRHARNLDSLQGATVTATEWDGFGADACFIDATGGYGAGWIDQLRQLGRAPIGVQFAGQATNSQRYFNKRAEMYFDMVAWIKDGGALWRSDRLKQALTQTTYTFKGDRLILESKDDIKAKLGFSPDEADALAMTFAAPVLSQQTAQRPGRHQVDYDPFADPFARGLGAVVAASMEYDPFSGR